MVDNATLLRDYVVNGSETAFAELLSRHVDLVYSTALRLVGGDAALARDVAQIVFTDLARKAASLPRNVVLAGWLHRHTRFMAANAVRAECRRHAREQKAAAMQGMNDDSDAAWRELAPVLDEAIGRLRSRYRDAILLRFFDRQPLRAVGHNLGISEEAARKVVDRALAVLRTELTRRGVAISAASLLIALDSHAVSAAPAGLAAAMAHASLSSAPIASGNLGSLFKALLVARFQVTVIGLLFLAGVATPVLLNARPDLRIPPQTIPTPDTVPARPGPTISPGPVSAALEADSALARLERWLREADQSDPNLTGIADELRFLIWSLGASDYPQAWHLRDELRSVTLRNGFQYVLLDFWSKLDPQAAMPAAASVSKDSRSYNTVALVLGNWAEKDPDAAMAWARQSQPESRRPYRLAEALQGIARIDSLRALKLAEVLPGIGTRSLAAQTIIREWVERDPEAAAGYVIQRGANAFEMVARTWAESDPEAALAWARSSPRPEERDRAVEAVIRKWQQTDPEGALTWRQRNQFPNTGSVIHPKSQ